MSDQDAFEGDSSSSSAYDPHKFYTASRNRKGFGSSLRLTIPPEVLAEIGELVASRRVPDYKTASDFFRDAIVHRVRYLADQFDDGVEFKPSRLADAIIRNERVERLLMEQEAESSFFRNVESLMRTGGTELEKARALAKVQEIRDSLVDPEYVARLDRLILQYSF